ncbi:MAG TPA: PD-(D/E)XK nuclease family protein [Candidatus Kapabacteria bacterium]|nr:PD-(D/E)XK nuclease family protein [Candidatus Kapabacteria bacterium]
MGGTRPSLDGRSRGLATHTILQHVDLRGDFTADALKKQADGLVSSGILLPEEITLVDLEAIAAFWESAAGKEIRARSSEVRRELPFAFKLGDEDLAALTKEDHAPVPVGEFIVTQGVADLVVLGRSEIWLIDFKTDTVKAPEVRRKAEEYRAQILLYSLALERIYRKPVTRKGLYFLSVRKLEWLE